MFWFVLETQAQKHFWGAKSYKIYNGEHNWTIYVRKTASLLRYTSMYYDVLSREADWGTNEEHDDGSKSQLFNGGRTQTGNELSSLVSRQKFTSA